MLGCWDGVYMGGQVADRLVARQDPCHLQFSAIALPSSHSSSRVIAPSPQVDGISARRVDTACEIEASSWLWKPPRIMARSASCSDAIRAMVERDAVSSLMTSTPSRSTAPPEEPFMTRFPFASSPTLAFAERHGDAYVMGKEKIGRIDHRAEKGGFGQGERNLFPHDLGIQMPTIQRHALCCGGRVSFRRRRTGMSGSQSTEYSVERTIQYPQDPPGLAGYDPTNYPSRHTPPPKRTPTHFHPCAIPCCRLSPRAMGLVP